MRVSSATAKMRADVSSGGSRIGRGADGGDEKSLAAAAVTASEEETATSASAAARLAATAPTATRRRRTAASASAAAPEKEKKNKEHPPILTFSFPGPLKKLFFRGAGGKRAEEAKKKEKKRTENGLAHYEELPDFLKDNDFVRSWYRRESTPRAAVESLWRLHNETGNIWSHALGFALFALFALLFLRAAPTTLVPPPAALKQLEARLHLAGHGGVHSHHLASYFSSLAARAGEAAKHGARDVVRVEKALVAAAVRLERRAATSLGEDARAAAHRADDAATAAAALLGARWPAPRWPALVFLAGAMTCLGTSAACHLFGCCAQHVAAAVWRADYAGIVVLIVASFVPPVVYGFECHPFLSNFYLWSTVSLGAATTCVTLLEFFQAPRFRTFRAVLFTALGSWGFAPALHGLVLYGRDEPAMRQAFAHYATMGALYVIGAATFAARIPERWAPGKFDIWGHSHQLFHVAIVAAAAVHWRGIRILLAWREGVGGFCH